MMYFSEKFSKGMWRLLVFFEIRWSCSLKKITFGQRLSNKWFSSKVLMRFVRLIQFFFDQETLGKRFNKYPNLVNFGKWSNWQREPLWPCTSLVVCVHSVWRYDQAGRVMAEPTRDGAIQTTVYMACNFALPSFTSAKYHLFNYWRTQGRTDLFKWRSYSIVLDRWYLLEFVQVAFQKVRYRESPLYKRMKDDYPTYERM